MKAFVRLLQDLESTPQDKGEILAQYFQTVTPEDGAWSLYFLSGRRLNRLVTLNTLRHWAMQYAGLPGWLFELSVKQVSNTAEGIALVIDTCHPSNGKNDQGVGHWVAQRILPIKQATGEDEARQVMDLWQQLDLSELTTLNQLLLGRAVASVPKRVLVQALSQAFGVGKAELSHRLAGDWGPSAAFFEGLVNSETCEAMVFQPWGFHRIAPCAQIPSEGEWLAQWKWPGIRVHLIKLQNHVCLWSETDQWVTRQFPELVAAMGLLPDGTVLEGDIVLQEGTKVRNHMELLQRRVARDGVDRKIIEEAPVIVKVSDLLMIDGKDIRHWELKARLERLACCLEGKPGVLEYVSPLDLKDQANWVGCKQVHGADGVLIKEAWSAYGESAPWLAWEAAPMSLFAILLYAQPCRLMGRESEYTFALWDEGELVPIARTGEGLSREEQRELDNWVVENTVQRFGPVRSVPVMQVFELAFESVVHSNRHKAGLTLKGARILRWDKNRSVFEAHQLHSLRELLSPPRRNTLEPV